MKNYLILFNPKANSGKAKEVVHKLDELLKGSNLVYEDITLIKDIPSRLSTLDKETYIVIAGGDGTLSRFASDIGELDLQNEVFFFGVGTGNDFLNDIGLKKEDGPHNITKYLKDLPIVYVNGIKARYINGIGYGIDGYCCEEADKILAKDPTAVINYTSIAIKGLLGKFKPRNAKITVDGKSFEVKHLWLAPAMNGRYFGGGMMCAPNQDRLNKERKISLVYMHGCRKLKTLILFPSIFKGKHIEHTKYVSVIEGYDIHVSFDKPCALQIDGETVLNVSEYRATSAKLK
ncbi:MAG: hypothetical protein HUK24_01475 [Sphaerochaetaceae bacterium]|nr:hypothetical protein [Sphaerochaetaceae bacterium]